MSLILNRRPGEKILIGDDIVVTFKGFNNNSAVLAIDAPKNVQILREEIKDKKFERKENSSNRASEVPFLRAFKNPKEPSKKGLAGAVEVIGQEVRAVVASTTA